MSPPRPGDDRRGPSSPPSYVVVIPTIGRPCLQDCLDALAAASGPLPLHVVLADDRPDTPDPLPAAIPAPLAGRTTVVTLEGRGPAAARNAGWRAAPLSDWVVFVDDDVRIGPRWRQELAGDLLGAPPDVAALQALIAVPAPPGRRPTDAERATIRLARARWITADMAIRRTALVDAGGFDERFPRAYREDSDLALRLLDHGWRICRGSRRSTHPLRPGSAWSSLPAQAGNRDDAAMARLHGRSWRTRAGASLGRRPGHLAACGAAAGGLLLALAGRRRAAGIAGLTWLGLTAEFALARIAPGPRTRREVVAMTVTSAAIPPLAVFHWLAGLWRHRRSGPWPPRPAAVLFDRDGTLIRDVPYNPDPGLVAPAPDAAPAVARLRREGVLAAVVTNQSGIAKGLLTPGQVDSVNRRVDELVGPFDAWLVCPHGPDDGCRCRKPAPGMVNDAAAMLGVDPADCVLIGDTGADVAAARAAGARAVLVPNSATLAREKDGVPCAASLAEAVDAILAGRRLPSWGAAPHLAGRGARR